MSDLLEQLYAAIALLLPGFVALHAGYRIYGARHGMSDLEKSTWSLFLSLAILGFYLLATDQELEEIAANPATLVTTSSLLALLLCVILATVIIMVWLMVRPLDKLNKKLYAGRSEWATSDLIWLVFLEASKHHAIIVETTAGAKFYGRLMGYSWTEGDRAVRLLTEHAIRFDDQTNSEQMLPYRAEMLVPYEQIVSLIRVPL